MLLLSSLPRNSNPKYLEAFARANSSGELALYLITPSFSSIIIVWHNPNSSINLHIFT